LRFIWRLPWNAKTSVSGVRHFLPPQMWNQHGRIYLFRTNVCKKLINLVDKILDGRRYKLIAFGWFLSWNWLIVVAKNSASAFFKQYGSTQFLPNSREYRFGVGWGWLGFLSSRIKCDPRSRRIRGQEVRSYAFRRIGYKKNLKCRQRKTDIRTRSLQKYLRRIGQSPTIAATFIWISKRLLPTIYQIPDLPYCQLRDWTRHSLVPVLSPVNVRYSSRSIRNTFRRKANTYFQRNPPYGKICGLRIFLLRR